jgi:hypothetical protein
MGIKINDNKVVLISEKDYIPELEEKVRYYMSTSSDFESSTVKHTRVKIPVHKDEYEKGKWEREEIRRCMNGHKGMSAKMYFWFNYVWIKNLKGGKIAPEFRVADDRWFTTIQEAQDSEEWGVVCVKRRRVGASWKEAADVLHDCSFKPFYNVGMNSKGEVDSQQLFNKVKFIYDNLPVFLRATSSAGKSKNAIDFSYYVRDENGNKIKRGTQSEIIVKAPTDSAFEGLMLNKWIADEAGKIPNLAQMWSFTEDCLMQETQRIGVPILFGTSGDIGRDGRGLKEMWDNADVYKLKRFFFAGWMGLLVDEYGNDKKEDAIRWIVYQRHVRKTLSAKLYSDFLQRYPLTLDEAFSQASEGGLGDIVKINAQMTSLTDNPPRAVRGWFKINRNDEVVFSPDRGGKCVIYEHAKKGMNNLYVAGCDPADHDDAYDEASDLSMYIMRKPHGIEEPRIVFEYTDRPRELNAYYEQSILALRYYNETKVLIERNRYRMISYYDLQGYKHLLNRAPQGVMRLVGGRADVIGINMTPAVKNYLEDLNEEYVDDYCEQIPTKDLLEEMVKYGTTNTDRVMAFGLALMMLKEDKRGAAKRTNVNNTLPRFKYERTASGKIIRVVN